MIKTKDGENTIEQAYYVNEEHGWKLSERRVFDESDNMLDVELIVTGKNGKIVNDERLVFDVWQFEWKLVGWQTAKNIV